MKLLFKQRFFSWLDSYDVYDEYENTVYVVKGQLSWCATRQVDNEKNIKFLYCPVCAGQSFYAANNRS